MAKEKTQLEFYGWLFHFPQQLFFTVFAENNKP